jgi:hypothetical protein
MTVPTTFKLYFTSQTSANNTTEPTTTSPTDPIQQEPSFENNNLCVAEDYVSVISKPLTLGDIFANIAIAKNNTNITFTLGTNILSVSTAKNATLSVSGPYTAILEKIRTNINTFFNGDDSIADSQDDVKHNLSSVSSGVKTSLKNNLIMYKLFKLISTKELVAVNLSANTNTWLNNLYANIDNNWGNISISSVDMGESFYNFYNAPGNTSHFLYFAKYFAVCTDEVAFKAVPVELYVNSTFNYNSSLYSTSIIKKIKFENPATSASSGTTSA